MNWNGVIIGAVSFLMIGIFHPIVIKCEYYFTAKVWPAFLVVGLLLCGGLPLCGGPGGLRLPGCHRLLHPVGHRRAEAPGKAGRKGLVSPEPQAGRLPLQISKNATVDHSTAAFLQREETRR